MKRIVLLLMFVSVLMALQALDEQYLRHYMEMGMQSNLELQALEAKVHGAHAKQYQAFSGMLPSLDLSSRYTEFEKESKMSTPFGDFVLQPKKSTETKLELTQVLFSPALYYNYRMQRNSTQSTDLEYQLKRTGVALSILEAYANCMKTSELVMMRQASLELAREAYYTTTRLYSVEKVPETDVLRAQVGMMTSEQDLRDAENTQRLTRNVFNSLLNRDMNTEVEMNLLTPETLESMDVTQEFGSVDSLDQALVTAQKQRLELQQADQAVRMMQNVDRITKSGFLPSLVAVGDYGYARNNFDYTKDDDSWTITGMLQWNLFSGFGKLAKVAESRAQVRQMERTQAQAIQGIELDVRNSYQDYLHYRHQFEVSQRTYQAARRNYTSVQKQYENELAPLLNLLDAKTVLDASKTGLVSSYFDVMLAKARYQKSIGNPILN